MRTLLLSVFLLLSFIAKAQPNILVIVLDDARFDSFYSNDSTSIFSSPSITRIAEEGVRFDYAFPALSRCSPSRASINTGLYPHHHGVIANKKVQDVDFPYITASKILHDNGYYTGFTGKYGYKVITAADGFDYVLESTSDLYLNSKYYYNSLNQNVITGHKTDVITDKAIEFLESVPIGQPFLLFVEHKAAHAPYNPRPQDSGAFDNVALPFIEMKGFDHDFPSPYTECYNVDTDQLKLDFKRYYELLKGASESIDTIIKFLDDAGILDSTLIIFTSDNGFMFGEHLFDDKEVAFEESIRVPMFIRYPEWFEAETVISDNMAMNIDIAPTLLDAAGIPDTFEMDGMSMRNLNRKEILYEYFQVACKPTLTAVRDFDYKFVSSRCSNVVEEFYDLNADPKENNNLINDSASQTLIQTYREKLDSLKTVYGYVLVNDTTLDCALNNATCSGECNIEAVSKPTDISGENGCDDGKIKLTFSGDFNAFIHVEIYDNDDSLISEDDAPSGAAHYTFLNLNAGNYKIIVSDNCCSFELEDIEVKCAKPSGLSATSITTTTATVDWNTESCNDGYKLQYRINGEGQGWTNKTPTTNSYNLTGLTPATLYEWRVSVKCDDANPSMWGKYSAINNFVTQ